MAKMHLTLQQTQLIYDLTGQRITSYNVDEATKNEIDKLNKSINTSNSSIEETQKVKGAVNLLVAALGFLAFKGSPAGQAVIGINTTVGTGVLGLTSLTLAGAYMSQGDMHNASAEIIKASSSAFAVAGASARIGGAFGAIGGVAGTSAGLISFGKALGGIGIALGVSAFIMQNAEDVVEADRLSYVDFLENLWDAPIDSIDDYMGRLSLSTFGLVKHAATSLVLGAYDIAMRKVIDPVNTALLDNMKELENILSSISKDDELSWLDKGLIGWGGILTHLFGLGDIHHNANDAFNDAQNFVPRRDPLTLDLNNNGIETLGVDAGVTFDFDGDGIKIGTGWVAATDGMLVYDRDGNGTIDNGGELFGVDTVKADGTKATDGSTGELNGNQSVAANLDLGGITLQKGLGWMSPRQLANLYYEHHAA